MKGAIRFISRRYLMLSCCIAGIVGVPLFGIIGGAIGHNLGTPESSQAVFTLLGVGASLIISIPAFVISVTYLAKPKEVRVAIKAKENRRKTASLVSKRSDGNKGSWMDVE
jgi:type III secretory pathway component EscV